MDVPSESPLEQSERHIQLGEEHIAKQKVLIAELQRDGHDSMLPAAQKFLEMLEQCQTAHLEHAEVRQQISKEKGSG